MAIWGKHFDVVEYLLSLGWDVDSPITKVYKQNARQVAYFCYRVERRVFFKLLYWDM